MGQIYGQHLVVGATQEVALWVSFNGIHTLQRPIAEALVELRAKSAIEALLKNVKEH